MSGQCGDGTERGEQSKCGFCGSMTFRVHEKNDEITAIECAVCEEVFDV